MFGVKAPARRPASRLASDRKGTVALVAAIGMMMLIYAAAIALDLADVYYWKTIDQRIADQSAIAAAFAYAQSGSTATAQNAAASLAVANGAGTATVALSIVNSPSGDGRQAAMVIVTSQVALSGLGRVATKSAKSPNGLKTFAVSATAYAEVHEGTPCIIALQNAGVTATGGVTTTATACSIASNGNVTPTSGANITAQAIYAVGSAAASNGATLATSPTAGQIFPGSSIQQDPYANAQVFSRLSTVSAMTRPNFPSVGSAPSGGTAQSCSGTMTIKPGSYGTISSSYYPTCSGINFSGGGETDIGGSGIQVGGGSLTLNLAAGVYKINGINSGSSGTVTINMTGNVTLYIWSGITSTGSAQLTFNGTATYYVQGGITGGSSSALTFTNTNSSSPSSFTISGGIDITNSSASFPNATYTITSGDSAANAGIDLSGGTSATFGNGSFIISNGINMGGGANLTIGSGTSASSLMQIPSTATSGNAISTSGGGSLILGSFTNVDVNGPIAIQGNLTLGAGAYTINGAANIASSGGGSITGQNVSIVASGAIAFGAGFSTVNMTAPAAVTSATEGSASTIMMASNSTTASVVTAGASSTGVVGVFYTPNAALQLSGSGKLTGGGNCLQLIVGSIALSGGGGITTNCAALGSSSSSGSVSLVQ